MRISIEPTDPGHATYQDLIAKGARPEVYLDGIRQSDAITADEVNGEIIRYKRDDEGSHVLTLDREAIEKEVVRGRVEIRDIRDV